MGVIIGAATTVSFSSGHATQVSWTINPNVQRAYVLGQWGPYEPAQIKSPTETMNVTVYTPGPTYSTEPTDECVLANQIAASVSPAGCGSGSDGPSSTNWYVNSYSCSKGDPRQPGSESWSLQQYVTLGDAGVRLPTYVLRGISEGSATGEEAVGVVAPKAGVVFEGTADSGTTGSVSAGQIGRSDNQFTGVISQVGGSTCGTGDIVSSSCSIPYTPLYID